MDTQSKPPSPKNVPHVSYVHQDGTLVELVHNGTQTAFAVFKNGTFSIEPAFKKDERIVLVPYRAGNNIIRNGVVLFAEKPAEYGSHEDLFDEIRWYIHRYVDVPPAFERIASAYVLLTWLYDRFKELPYLRLRGDYGSGKTRFLQIVGAITYKPIFASGASTVSPLFHLLDTFRGTLIVDEADFRFTDEKAEIVKLLNNGNAAGMPVLRTIVTAEREYNPRAFTIFGPKLMATRGSFDDRALESRFITEEMGTRPFRTGVPIILPDSQKAEAQALRNKLLLYRFRTWHKATTVPYFFELTVEPRLKQIFVPLMSVVDDLELRAELEEIAARYSNQATLDRGLTLEAQLLECISALWEDAGSAGVTVKAIADEFLERFGTEYDNRITTKWIGGLVRRRLQLATRKSRGSYVIPLEEAPKINRLVEKYGIADVPPSPDKTVVVPLNNQGSTDEPVIEA